MALLAARATRSVARAVGYGGSSLPGLVAERIAPGLLPRLARRFRPVVLVAGTNGKTTTSRLIVAVTETTFGPTVGNVSGANLRQSIVAVLLAGVANGGSHEPAGPAVLEVDELALADVAASVPASVVVLTNLFRDQLDRFGEVDTIVERWRAVVDGLDPETVVVSCADDPRLEALVAGRPRVLRFGLAGPPAASPARRHLRPDPATCPTCGRPLRYAWRSIGHLGAFACRSGHLVRREPDVVAAIEADDGVDGLSLSMSGPAIGRPLRLDVRLGGLANAYNVAAAFGAAIASGIEPTLAARALARADAAFGRLERLDVGGREVVLALAKNPASLTEMGVVVDRSNPSAVVLALNDAPADGRDVSWIWDVPLAGLVEDRAVALAGTRAADLLLRLKYESPPAAARAIVAPDGSIEGALDAVLAATAPGESVFVVATYTAMLEVRAALQRRGLAAPLPG